MKGLRAFRWALVGGVVAILYFVAVLVAARWFDRRALARHYAARETAPGRLVDIYQGSDGWRVTCDSELGHLLYWRGGASSVHAPALAIVEGGCRTSAEGRR